MRIGKVAAVWLLTGVVMAACASCDKTVCGNGVVESGEECDDGNEAGWDGCDACRITACGNGVVDVDEGEECDDGSPTGWDGCTGCRIAEVQVNLPPFDEPGDLPDVAVHADSRFVVVWIAEGSASWESRIYAQRFDADGQRVGGPIDVSGQMTLGKPPAVAMASDGRFVVAWDMVDETGLDSIAVGRRFSSSGAAEGDTFPVAGLSSVLNWPDVLMSPDDRALITWPEWLGSGFRLFGQWYQADGTADGSPVVFVDEQADTSFPTGVVAIQDATRLVAAWWRQVDDPSTSQLVVQRQTVDGTPLGPPITLDDGVDGSLRAVVRDAVAFPGGEITIAYSTNGGDYTQTVGPDGAVLSPPELLAYESQDVFSGTLVSMAASESAGVVTYSAERYYSSPREYLIMGRLFTSTGQRVGEDFRVNLRFADDALMYDDGVSSAGHITSAVGMAADGSFVVVWDVSGMIFAKRFSPEGVPLGLQ